jgi:hypothetical protein
MQGPLFTITRENHLNHMTRVVPFIVFLYAIQCYMLGSLVGGSTMLTILGGFLGVMISCFIAYDLNHKVYLFDDHLSIQFLGKETRITYSEIESITIKERGESFSSLTLIHSKGKSTFYFIDQAEKIEDLILNSSKRHRQAA